MVQIPVIFLIISLFLISALAIEPTTLWTTDIEGNIKTDFAPGEMVYISGSGFNPFATVDISITRPDNTVEVCPLEGRCGELPVANEFGSFSNYIYDLNGIEGEYIIDANDGTNSVQMIFTDYPGMIWTSRNGCDNPQNENHYNPGDEVWIKGDNFGIFGIGGNFDWKITGKPGSCDPNIIVASGNFPDSDGIFCFYAYTINTDDCLEYRVEVKRHMFEWNTAKKDNYHVTGITQVCGNGVVEGTEQCDPGTNNPNDCCTSDCMYESSSYTCRGSAGVCDIAETCSGSSANCPGDSKSTVQCRASAGDCDIAEFCDGINDNCPSDSFLPASTECRVSSGDCDIAEYCTGSSATCPSDQVQPSSYICRNSAGICDLTEYCDGLTKICPSDLKSTALCRASAGICDIEEYCNEIDNDCPTDSFLPDTTVCRLSAGPCDLEEKCTGSSASCPADIFKPSGFVCQSASNQCDKDDICTGSSADCPDAGFQPLSTPCDDGQFCSLADHCDGNGACVQLTARDCSDSNECTDDICNENLDQCEHPPKPEGTYCGLFRDCPVDTCNLFKAEFYPDDGHDTCDGSGICTVYSCAMEQTYCTDNDPSDGVNGLTCGASCDQDTDCLQTTEFCDYANKQYCTRDSYGTCGGNCECIEDSWSCDTGDYCLNCNHCGDGTVNCGEECESGDTGDRCFPEGTSAYYCLDQTSYVTPEFDSCTETCVWDNCETKIVTENDSERCKPPEPPTCNGKLIGNICFPTFTRPTFTRPSFNFPKFNFPWR